MGGRLVIHQEESREWDSKRSLSLQREGLEAPWGTVNAETVYGAAGSSIDPDGALVRVRPGDLDREQRSILQAGRAHLLRKAGTERPSRPMLQRRGIDDI